jgi:hypothetical protein
VAKPELLSLSTPYLDAFGAGTIVTVSKAVLRPVATPPPGADAGADTAEDRVVASMGVDLTLVQLKNLIFKEAPACDPSSNGM